MRICVLHKSPIQTMSLVEYPPMWRNITINRKNYYLVFPWTFFIHSHWGKRLTNLKMVFSNRSFSSYRQRLYTPCLPNIFGDFSVCLGRKGQDIRAGIRDFWTRQFIDDLTFDWYGPTLVDLSTWLKIKKPTTLMKIIKTYDRQARNFYDIFDEEDIYDYTPVKKLVWSTKFK